MALNAAAPKEKRKPSEKRKEKSRDAARCRRSRESEIFTDLAAALPLPTSVVSHLDKASIMRLIITHLRIMKIFKKIETKKEIKKDSHDDLFLKAVGGFVLVLALDGDIIFISNNVSTYLGISQVDLLGQSIYEVTHPCDHSDIKEVLSVKNDPSEQSSFFLRMKSTLSSKGRSINIKSASYKVLRINGRFMELDGALNDKFSFVTIATPIPHPSDIDAPLGAYIFLSKHSLDMKFTYADERMTYFLGYEPKNLIGKSMYQYHHIQDNSCIEKTYKALFARGQSETGMYRFLAQGGGYVWVSTQATIIYCDKGTKPQSIVCVNYVISEKLHEDEVYTTDQLEWVMEHEKERILPTEMKTVASPPKLTSAVKSEQPSPRPQPATIKIFAPKTAEMNQGFLSFSDENGSPTLCKDEPDDLTYLAPVDGGVCVSLDIPLHDVFNNVTFNPDDQYCPLINADAVTPLFSSYRDDGSTNSLSPDETDRTGCNLPSLIVEPSSFEEANMKTILGLDLIDADTDDLNKAQYICDEMEDIPSLMPFDLAWNVNFQANSNNSSSRCSPVPHEMNTDSLPELKQYLQNDENTSVSTIQSEFFIAKSLDKNESQTLKRVFPSEQDTAKKRKHQTLPVSNFGSNESMLQNLFSGHDLVNSFMLQAQKNPVIHNFQNKI
ncbi:hypoxia-inducible factor 1-alpha-like [Cimex lectularius]|uniref:Hypoxia-inducible factor 1-alpha n=1 Tax=Cimex lectularius TaxID=79782 RepID=A0A8I6RY81_CIMLE|nr:hypoxia-inducible factor 1-alpha-like [Cimex lectularius]